MLKQYASRSTNRNKHHLKSGENYTNRSGQIDSLNKHSTNEKPTTKKKFKDDNDLHRARTLSRQSSNFGQPRMGSNEDSHKSPSIFEELSIGQSLEQIHEDVGPLANRSLTQLQ